MPFLLRPASIWFLLNAIGMAAYLFFASTLWVRPGEEGTPGGPGDAFYWLVYLAPVQAVFFILDAIALFIVVCRAIGGRKGTLILWLGVALLWTAVLAFDQYKSFRRIDGAPTVVPP